MNAFEKKVHDKYTAEGWLVLRDGWPDFLCVRKNPDGGLSLMGIEAKTEDDKLRPSQLKMLAALSAALPIREVREGPGYGDNERDMHVLVYDLDRFERYEGGTL